MFLSLNLFSFDLQQPRYYLYVYTTNENLKPNIREKGISNDEALNQIFREFGVVNYYQSFPGAKNINIKFFMK